MVGIIQLYKKSKVSKNDGRSFEFCLTGLSDTKTIRLTTENKTEMCEMNSPEVIILAGPKKHAKGRLVQQTNNIPQCINHERHLGSSNLKAANVRSQNEANSLFHLVDDSQRFQVEHNYSTKKNPRKESPENSSVNKRFCQILGIENAKEKSPAIAPTLQIAIDRKWVGGKKKKRESPTAKQTSSNVEALKTAKNSSHVPQQTKKGSDRVESISLLQRLREATSPELATVGLSRKFGDPLRPVEHHPLASTSRATVSPTVLRDKFNKVKVLDGGKSNSFCKVEKFRLASSDSEDSNTSFNRVESPEESEPTVGSTRSVNNVAIDDSLPESSDELQLEEAEPARCEPRDNSAWVQRKDVNREKKGNGHLLSRKFLNWEQRQMIKYLIDKNAINSAKGNLIWQNMISDGLLTHRTYQSLQNHFRRCILPRINKFELSPKNLKKFKRLSKN